MCSPTTMCLPCKKKALKKYEQKNKNKTHTNLAFKSAIKASMLQPKQKKRKIHNHK